MENDEDSDEGASLMLAVRDGDTKAFDRIVLRYYKPVLNFFYRLGVPLCDVEDLAQQTFIRLYRFRAYYEKKSKFTTYLFLLARRVRIDEIRKSIRRKKVNEAFRKEVAFQESLPPKSDNTGLKDDLRQALLQLSEPYREVVILGLIQGLPYQEVAEIVGVPVGTVKSRIHYALKKLRGILE